VYDVKGSHEIAIVGAVSGIETRVFSLQGRHVYSGSDRHFDEGIFCRRAIDQIPVVAIALNLTVIAENDYVN
jgi:hypothetical protein